MDATDIKKQYKIVSRQWIGQQGCRPIQPPPVYSQPRFDSMHFIKTYKRNRIDPDATKWEDTAYDYFVESPQDVELNTLWLRDDKPHYIERFEPYEEHGFIRLVTRF